MLPPCMASSRQLAPDSSRRLFPKLQKGEAASSIPGPGQMNNLLHRNPTQDTRKEWGRLHKILTERLVASANLPDSFGWPLQPALA